MNHSSQDSTETKLKAEASSSQDEDDNSNNIHPLVALIGGTTSAVVSALCFGTLVWKRDGIMVAFFLGSVANAVLSKVLKKVLGQTRPPDLVVEAVRLQPSDGGMPSSHAMSLGFIGLFTCLHLAQDILVYAGPLIYVFTLTSLVFRVQVKLHTWQQVVVGFVVGTGNAFLFHQHVEQDLIHVLQRYILNEQGLLPWPLLVVPAIVGILIVGSVERRISNWMQQRTGKGVEKTD